MVEEESKEAEGVISVGRSVSVLPWHETGVIPVASGEFALRS